MGIIARPGATYGVFFNVKRKITTPPVAKVWYDSGVPYKRLSPDLRPRGIFIKLGPQLRNPTGNEGASRSDLPDGISVEGWQLALDFFQREPPGPTTTAPYPIFHVDHPGEPRPSVECPNWALFVNLSEKDTLTLPYIDRPIFELSLLASSIARFSYLDLIAGDTDLNYVTARPRDERTACAVWMPLGQVLHTDCGPNTDFGVPMARYSLRMNPGS